MATGDEWRGWWWWGGGAACVALCRWEWWWWCVVSARENVVGKATSRRSGSVFASWSLVCRWPVVFLSAVCLLFCCVLLPVCFWPRVVCTQAFYDDRVVATVVQAAQRFVDEASEDAHRSGDSDMMQSVRALHLAPRASIDRRAIELN